MEESVAKVGFDLKKLPLEQLTEETLKNGYVYLTKIEDTLKKGGSPSLLAEYSTQFYTCIPHNFGRQNMSNFIINTDQLLKDKMALISDLIDIKAAYSVKKGPKSTSLLKKKKTMKKAKKVNEEPNPLDEDFAKLKCEMDLLKKTDAEYKTLEEYIRNTSEGRTINIIDAFKIEREGEEAVFNPDNLGGKKLLFHGSRFSNYVGILSNGMRIAPPEAPRSGYLFGKGVYFAD